MSKPSSSIPATTVPVDARPSSVEPSLGTVDVSIVLPTYREAAALPIVVPDIVETLVTAGYRAEVIIVDDDSPDGTAAVAHRLARDLPVRVIERKTERGLATAVLAGFAAATGGICVVMDADGSHPANALLAMIEPLFGADRTRSQDAAVLSVGSRHLPGGGFRKSSWTKRLVSRFAAFFARTLTPLSDPTSGFMAIRKEVLDELDLDPIGWKIVLETVVKAQPRPFVEIPIVFDPRKAGRSKQSLRVFGQYLLHCWRLRSWRRHRQK